ncbi:MAG: hypothetical protein ACRERE_08580 [Candidatus Entotheonellia bacterium]
MAGDLAGFNKNPNESDGGVSAVNVRTALKHLAKRKGAFDGIEGVYAIYSDFAHPNMASHSTVVNVSPPDDEINNVELCLHVDQPRGEFIIFATLNAICLCVQTVIELSMSLSLAFHFWNDELMEGKVRIHLRR